MQRLTLSTLLTAGMLLAAPLVAYAQSWPAKPIKIVVGFPPGGGTDILGRLIGQKLSESFGQSVLIENKPGASSTIAADFVAKSPPDGYTLLVGHINSHGIGPSVYPKLPYDPIKDFVPIVLFGATPLVLVTNNATSIKSVQDLAREAKAQPGKLSAGSGGNGSFQHLALEIFKTQAKVDIVHVPYKGSGPLLTDLIGGQIQLSFDSATAVASHVKGGTVRALATTRAKRSPAYPDLPTIAESGFPGFDVSVWYGLMAPKGTPKEVVTKINTEVNKILQMPDIKAKLAEFGAEDGGGTPERFGEFIQSEMQKYATAVKEANVKIDN